MPQRQAKTSSHRQTSPVSFSRHRRTESMEYQSDTAEPATPKGVQWRPCVAKCHNFNARAPLLRRLFQVSRRATSGNRFVETISCIPLEPLPVQPVRRFDSTRLTSARAPSAQGFGMALLMVWVDPDIICLTGRGRSNTMLCYLHMMETDS